ncbi:MAG TPA: arginine--tRNA ligase [Candidatus Bathyarchaeia archaeon]|nr:arginine--tRNA ligase [Candidatus Bathyarchaeia archaeon]
MIEDQIKKDLSGVLKKLRISTKKLVLEHPAQPEHGDFSTNLALQVKARHLRVEPLKKLAPWDLANKIVNTWRGMGLPDYLVKIEVAKPGFVNIWLKNEVLVSQVERVLKEKDRFGTGDLGKGKSVMFEFSHPNTHKLFHIGHLRTTSLGESLARLYQALGFKVVRANYQGDVGLHIAKCLWGIRKLGLTRAKDLKKKMAFLGKAYTEGSKAYEKSKKAQEEIRNINYLVYAAAQKFYQKKLPRGLKLIDYSQLVKDKTLDPQEISKLWQKTRKWSLDYFAEIYKRLNTRFDRYYFEGEVADQGRDLVLKNLKKGVFKKSQGAIIFPGEKHGLHNRVFINQIGLPTYEAKDMALGKIQFSEYPVQKIVHVVGPEQIGYFQVVFKALEALFPATKGKESHLSYGWVRLREGKMSSREGGVITVNWLVDEAKKAAEAIIKKSKYSKKVKETIAEAVAIGAVKYWILKFSPSSEIAFDIKGSVSLEGDSAPYLQYTHARCQSVLRKAKTKPVLPEAVPEMEEEELALLRTLYKFPEVVAQAGESFAPNLICGFLFDLAQKYNLFYNRHSILKGPSQETVQLRLALTMAVGQILQNGLNLVGIDSPERM